MNKGSFFCSKSIFLVRFELALFSEQATWVCLLFVRNLGLNGFFCSFSELKIWVYFCVVFVHCKRSSFLKITVFT